MRLPQRRIGLILAAWLPLAAMAQTASPAAAPAAQPERAAAPALQGSQRMKPLPQPVGPDADSVFKLLDQDGNGSISRAEFDHWWARRAGSGQMRIPLRTQFDRLDRNRNGGLDQDEYAQMILIRQAGPAAPPLSRFDANRNGRLDYDEYLQLVNQLSRVQTRQAPAKPGAAR